MWAMGAEIQNELLLHFPEMPGPLGVACHTGEQSVCWYWQHTFPNLLIHLMCHRGPASCAESPI